MTQRSIRAGKTPTVIVRGSMDVQVEGWDDERVLATTGRGGGLQVERRSESALGHVRARAKVGDRVLFDLSTDLPPRKNKPDAPEDPIQVHASGAVVVRVPYGSTVRLYAGTSIEVRDIRGAVTAYAGHDLRLRDVRTVVHVSSGRAMDVECETLATDDVKISAGRDLRLYVRDLDNATVRVDDLGGYWAGIIGDGHRQIRLHAGGDVTLVTDRPVRGESPEELLGRIELPKP